MKDRIIRFFIQLLICFFKPKWQKGKPKILINESDQWRAMLLLKKITDDLHGLNPSVCVSSSKLQFLSYIREADFVYSYGLSKYASPENLKLLYIGQVGHVEIAGTKNFKIVNAPNLVFENIADYVLAMVFSFERGLIQNLHLKKAKKWSPKVFLDLDMKNISDLKVGIIGLGLIGSQIAKRFIQNKCEIHVYDRVLSRMEGYKNNYNESNWKDMLKYVDYLILSMSNEGNSNLITSSVLSIANSRLCLVNISRGSMVNEQELLTAVKLKYIRGAILDVFNLEPLPKRHPFWNQNGIVVTPHVAGNINMVFEKVADDFVKNVKGCIDGII
jgi:phosphoglycerate dehydrogenase-like enzyme